MDAIPKKMIKIPKQQKLLPFLLFYRMKNPSVPVIPIIKDIPIINASYIRVGVKTKFYISQKK